MLSAQAKPVLNMARTNDVGVFGRTRKTQTTRKRVRTITLINVCRPRQRQQSVNITRRETDPPRRFEKTCFVVKKPVYTRQLVQQVGRQDESRWHPREAVLQKRFPPLERKKKYTVPEGKGVARISISARAKGPIEIYILWKPGACPPLHLHNYSCKID